MRTSVALLSTLILASCGSTSGSDSISFDRVFAANAVYDRVDETPNSRFDAVPTSGTVQFTGFADFQINDSAQDPADRIGVLGDAEIVADFGAGTVVGRVDNLIGATADFTDLSDFELFAVGGEIAIGGGSSQIGAGAPGSTTTLDPNQFTADYEGSITLPDQTLRVSGDLDGRFVGTRVLAGEGDIPIRGLLAEDLDGRAIDQVGGETTVTMTVYAEAPWSQ